jgi:hypothetical protein
MSILGSVETGWFAQLCRGCERISRRILNSVSGEAEWGDTLYAGMDKAADAHVQSVYAEAVARALEEGASRSEAFAAGRAALETIGDPSTLGEVGALAGTGTAIAAKTAGELAASPGILGGLAPLLAGAAVLGGVWLAADAWERRSSMY